MTQNGLVGPECMCLILSCVPKMPRRFSSITTIITPAAHVWVGRPCFRKPVINGPSAAASTSPQSRRPRWRFQHLGVNPSGGERD